MFAIAVYITARGINGFTQGWYHKTKQYDSKSGIAWCHNNELAGISVVWDMWMISSIGYFKYDKSHGLDFTLHFKRVQVGRGIYNYSYGHSWYDESNHALRRSESFEYIDRITRRCLGHKHGIQLVIIDTRMMIRFYQTDKLITQKRRFI